MSDDRPAAGQTRRTVRTSRSPETLRIGGAYLKSHYPAVTGRRAAAAENGWWKIGRMVIIGVEEVFDGSCTRSHSKSLAVKAAGG
jgi:hypothetical protein